MTFSSPTRPIGWRHACAASALAALLLAGQVQAGDSGPRAHAKGHYDAASATYVVADGDDLFAISERFGVPVDALKAANKLTGDQVQSGEKLHVAATAHKAAPASTSHHAAAKKPLATLTCEDFIGLDETFQPKAVYWAVAYSKDGAPEAEAVAVDGVETLVPIVVEECRKAPKETFWQKAKAEWAKLRAKL